MICKPSCVTDIPQNDWVNGCNITKRPGGIPRMLFLKCDPDYVHPNPGGFDNLDNWLPALCAGILYVTGEVLGQKPKGSVTKKRLQSCGPEEVVSGTKTVSWQDYNAEPDELLDYAFYDAIMKNRKFFKFGWISCDELVHMFNGDWDLEGDYVTEDNQDGNTFFDGVVTMSSVDLIVPVSVPGVLAVLAAFEAQYDCAA
jgi:hypothetical protein